MQNAMQYVDGHTLTQEEKAEREQRRLEREAEMRLRNNRLGLTVFQGSWILAFVCLVIAYWQIGFSPEWRPSASERPDMVLPTIATLGLLLSTWYARSGLKAVEADRIKAFLSRWLIAMGLGVVFFVIMVSQFFAVPASTDGQQYGFIYRLMIGYHAFHTLVIGIMMVQIWRLGRQGRYHADNSWSVEATAKLWYFVTVAWVLFYVVLYLI